MSLRKRPRGDLVGKSDVAQAYDTSNLLLARRDKCDNVRLFY
jgi:hypothetical protein